MLLSIALPYPKNPTRSQFNKLFGDIENGLQKEYNGSKIPHVLFSANSDVTEMMLRFLPYSVYKVRLIRIRIRFNACPCHVTK